MNKTDFVVINPKVKARKEDFGKLLVLSGLPLLSINSDAEFIWELCNEKISISDMVLKCTEHFNSSNEIVEEKVLDFIKKLTYLKLISVETDKIDYEKK